MLITKSPTQQIFLFLIKYDIKVLVSWDYSTTENIERYQAVNADK